MSLQRISRLLMVFSLVVYQSFLGFGWTYDLKENAILHANNGQLFLERGQADDAIEEFKAALRLNPYTSLSGALYNNLGLAYRATGQFALAYASFQHACRIQPTYALYYKNLIETYAVAGRLPAIERVLKSVLSRNVKDSEAWFLLGLLYREQGNRKAAKASFDKFLELEPASELARAARNAL